MDTTESSEKIQTEAQKLSSTGNINLNDTRGKRKNGARKKKS